VERGEVIVQTGPRTVLLEAAAGGGSALTSEEPEPEPAAPEAEAEPFSHPRSQPVGGGSNTAGTTVVETPVE
jgi:hypothetical protein